MRRIVLLTALLSLFSLMAASAATPPSLQPAPTPEVSAFLASLAAPSLPPAPIERTACMVSLECIGGGGTVTISCAGNVSCHVAARSVTCDGETERCPPITSCPH